MAAPQTKAPREEQSSGQGSANFQTFETSPPDREPPEPSEGGSGDDRSRGLLTVAAVVAALVLGFTIALLAEGLTTNQMLVTGALTSVVAFLGLVSIRWGWWVAAGVTTAFFGLVIYNLVFNQDSSVFSGSDPGDITYAVLGPGPGVLLGYVLQGLYSLIAGE